MPNGKKKDTPIAFVPIAPVQKEQVQAPTKIEQPQYPDSGTNYAGYSKKLYAGNTYKLTKQTPFDYNISYTPGLGVTGGNLTLSQASTEKHYITDLILAPYPNAVTTLTFQDTNSTGRTVLIMLVDGSGVVTTRHYHFSVPILINSNTLRINISPAAAATDTYAINIYGWSEPE